MASVILFLLAVGSAIVAAIYMKVAASAIHEIEALLLWVATGIFLSGSFIVANLDDVKSELVKARKYRDAKDKAAKSAAATAAQSSPFENIQ